MSEDSTPPERDSGAVRLVHPGERVGVHEGAVAGAAVRFGRVHGAHEVELVLPHGHDLRLVALLRVAAAVAPPRGRRALSVARALSWNGKAIRGNENRGHS